MEAVGAKLEEVRIEAIRGGTYYAVAKLKSGDRVREVDARPSDAIALAVHLGSPIYVAEKVLEEGKIDLPAEEVKKRQLGQGLDHLMQEMAEQSMKQQQQLAAKSPLTREEMREAQQKLITFLFGGESGQRNWRTLLLQLAYTSRISAQHCLQIK